MNSPSYYSRKCCINNNPCSNLCVNFFETNCQDKEKDILISQLKAHIFELELRVKDNNLLNERCCQLQKDIALLNDCQMKLECENKLKDDEFNKNIFALQRENENLNLNLEDKLAKNKDMFAENNCLNRECENKDSEICELKRRLNDLNIQLYKNNEDRNNLEQIINDVNNIRDNQRTKISKLLEDNNTLKGIISEQDDCINLINADTFRLKKELEDKNNYIKDLNCKIKINESNENNLSCKLNEVNNLNSNYGDKIKCYENPLNNLKYDNNILKNNLISEKSARIEENQKNKELCCILDDRNNKFNLLCQNNEFIKRQQEKASDRNCVLQEENSKLKKHNMILTDLNQTLMNEIDNVIIEDSKMKYILNRKDRINSILINNRCTLDKSLNCLDIY